MRTVILRLSDVTDDGQLHGVAEVVGSETSRVFTDDASLLCLLHDANRAEDADERR